MSAGPITVAVLALLACAAYSLKIMVEFKAFCESIARAEGRMDDYAKVWGSDEGGLNAFEREQYRRIMNGDFAAIADPVLLSRGQYLAARFRALFVAALLLIALLAYAASR